MTTTETILWRAGAVLLLAFAPTSLSAQTTPGACDPHPSLGITGLSCQDCTVSRIGSDRWASFSTEPRILSVAPDGPAAGVLRAGDVIVAVDDRLITTRAGGAAFVDFEVGDEVRLRIRRDGRERDVSVTSDARCAPAPPAPPAPEPAPSAATAPRPPSPAAPAPVDPAAPPAPQPRLPPAAPEPPAEVAGAMWQYSQGLPRLGMSLSCDDCSLRSDAEGRAIWTFTSSPEVRAVEPGSPAEAAGFRAGDRLLRIDGLDLRSPEGGRRMGGVTPGASVAWDVMRDGVLRTLRFRLPDAASPAPPAPPRPPAPAGPVRAVTRIGDVDVEVRGDRVVVLEDEGVVVIRADGVEVRLVRRRAPAP